MQSDRDLLKQALEALEWCLGGEPCGGEDAVRALRERLAQPEQEPVAWMQEMPTRGDEKRSVRLTTVEALAREEWANPIPLYTTPPRREWVGLTDDDLKPVCDEYRILFGGWVHAFARAIEAKLKEKNA